MRLLLRPHRTAEPARPELEAAPADGPLLLPPAARRHGHQLRHDLRQDVDLAELAQAPRNGGLQHQEEGGTYILIAHLYLYLSFRFREKVRSSGMTRNRFKDFQSW